MNDPSLDDRILLLTPTGRDGPLAVASLEKVGILAAVCQNARDLALAISQGAAAAIVAQEALTSDETDHLARLINLQPPWSDFPMILIAAGGQLPAQSAARYRMFQKLGNLTILERPFHRETLLVAAQSALRNRQRQYEARAFLLERKRVADELESRVEERTRDLADTQNALHQSQKLEAIGRLAGGVAHDFNNLMTGIHGLAEDLQSDMPEDDPKKSDLKAIVQAATRAGALTKQLLAFGRKQLLNPDSISLNDVLTGMESFFKRLLREDIHLEMTLDPAIRPIWIDRTSFEQILINLIINARDAMGKGGTIRLQTQAVGETPSRPEQVCLRVIDTGLGMSPDILSHIFEPFFTTKAPGQGTGLGLSTVYGNVKQSGGEIQVDSALEKGTTFTLIWPVSTAVPRSHLDEALPVPMGHETILIVEDEDIVRHVASVALRRRGYQVLLASSGSEAHKILETSKKAIDLLLVDVVMPGMDGKQVAGMFTANVPGKPVLYMSGHTEDVILHKGIMDQGIAFIQKPFTADSLCRKVHEILESKTSLSPSSK